MKNTKLNAPRTILLAVVVASFLLASACTPQAPVGIRAGLPTIVVTQVVTQVVATPLPVTPTAIPSPTFAAPPATAPGTIDYPIYYPIMDCVASRLHVDDQVAVVFGEGTVALRPDKDIYYAPILRYPTSGEVFTVVGGPWCSHEWLIWKVVDEAGKETFIPEGDGDVYFLLPIN